MMRFSILAVVLVVMAVAANPASSQQRGQSSYGAQPAAGQIADAERPMSIFNEQVRRFRFELEDTLVTSETAEGFMINHKARNQPEIIGAYPDSETNSLVVIGPPEAEHAIRVTLATWIVERQGLSPPPLKVQKRALEFRRKEVLQEMAALDIQSVGAESNKAAQLQARLQTFKDELNVVERKIEVVNRYIERLRETPGDSPKATAAR